MKYWTQRRPIYFESEELNSDANFTTYLLHHWVQFLSLTEPHVYCQ